jgi:hypothetical protein
MALFKGSAYETVKSFDPPEDGSPRFEGLRTRTIADPEPVLEHPVTVADRLDGLGQHYYANSREWRRIADCNPQPLFAEDLVYLPDASLGTGQPLGEVILIPRRREGTG